MSFRRGQDVRPVTQVQGLGDVVARAAQALGIPACAPCQERQARLNALFPWRGGR